MLLMCQNTTMWVYGAWIKIDYVYVQQHIAALEKCHNPLLVRDKLLGAPTSVKPVYCLLSYPIGVVSTLTNKWWTLEWRRSTHLNKLFIMATET